MNDVQRYAEWNEGSEDIASLSFVGTPQALREENRSHRLMTVDEAVERVRATGALTLHPLIGGLPPERAWPYLHNLVDKELPRLGRRCFPAPERCRAGLSGAIRAGLCEKK